MRAGGRGGFPIGAHQMGRVMLGDEAPLARGLPRLVDHQIGHDQAVELAERIGQRRARLIVADQADQNTFRTERRDVARHVAGAADLDRAVPDREHRRRRLGRYARDLAIDEIVEHEIADAEHGLLRNKPEGFFEIKHARYLGTAELGMISRRIGGPYMILLYHYYSAAISFDRCDESCLTAVW